MTLSIIWQSKACLSEKLALLYDLFHLIEGQKNITLYTEIYTENHCITGCGTFVLKLLTIYSGHCAITDMVEKKLILQLWRELSIGKNISSWIITPWDMHIKVNLLLRSWEKKIDFQTTIKEIQNTSYKMSSLQIL